MKNLATPNISAIVAMSSNQVIGNNNQLPWYLPADLKHFKMLTTGNIVLMGRKTFASIGKPLPNRINIILTRNLDFKAEGCVIIHEPQEAFNFIEKEKELFIIGGAEIYQEFLPYIHRIYLTLVHKEIIGDTYFPTLDSNEWQEMTRENHAVDEHHAIPYSFLTLERKG